MPRVVPKLLTNSVPPAAYARLPLGLPTAEHINSAGVWHSVQCSKASRHQSRSLGAVYSLASNEGGKVLPYDVEKKLTIHGNEWEGAKNMNSTDRYVASLLLSRPTGPRSRGAERRVSTPWADTIVETIRDGHLPGQKTRKAGLPQVQGIRPIKRSEVLGLDDFKAITDRSPGRTAWPTHGPHGAPSKRLRKGTCICGSSIEGAHYRRRQCEIGRLSV